MADNESKSRDKDTENISQHKSENNTEAKQATEVKNSREEETQQKITHEKSDGQHGSSEGKHGNNVTKNLPGVDDSNINDEADDEGIDLGDRTDLDGDERNKLFERGLKYDQAGKTNLALKCYMACLNGLKEDTWFPLLPQCLRNIGDIFYQKEEYDKAVHFIQAEKLYYECALIDTSDLQHRLEEQKNGQDGSSVQEGNLDTVRAEEYEHLAKLCLDKKQPQLALEYAGKAAKLRQKVLGDEHPTTLKSLDFFATVYAEVGAEQYQDSMQRFSSSQFTDEESSESPDDVPEFYSENQSTQEPVSILRKRKSSEKEKHVRFDESQLQDQEQAEQEEKCAKRILWGLFVVCSVLLTILGVYLYCQLVGSRSCTSFKTDLHYAYMRLKYYYYHFSSTPSEKYT